MKHKKLILFALMVLVVVLTVSMIAQPLRGRKWQDALAKPDHAWMTKFGYDDGSHLAYYIATLIDNDRRMDARIAELEKRLTALAGKLDPNDTEPVPNDPNE